ncbi:MAG: RadC family protein [Porcipelethomonas sp.]
MSENIHEGHRKRLREKFLKSGFTGFADHEKLELLLFYSRPRGDTNVIAHKLMDRFRTIGGVFDAGIEQLMEIKGISEVSAVLIKLIPELFKEYSLSKTLLQPLDTFERVCNFFKEQLNSERDEKLMVACVDDRLRLISCEVISEGDADSVAVNIRKLIEFTYKNNCSNILIAHNHPNGDTIPSDKDIKITREIYKVLKPVGITLLDHIIVAKGSAASLKESGGFALIK